MVYLYRFTTIAEIRNLNSESREKRVEAKWWKYSGALSPE